MNDVVVVCVVVYEEIYKEELLLFVEYFRRRFSIAEDLRV